MKYLPLALCICIFLSFHAHGQYITTIAGTGANGYSGDNGPATAAMIGGPRDLQVDDSGNIYIAESLNSCIRKINSSGIITIVAGIGGSIGYSGDNGMATDAQLTYPISIAVDKNGTLYIADYNCNCIRKVDATGIITTIAGTGTAGYNGDNIAATAALLKLPTGVAVDKYGNIYICDAYNYRIRKIDTFGIITTIAGTGVAGHSGDTGPATSANLEPGKIAVDTSLNIYFGEASTCIRKIDAAGIITTVAGNGTLGNSGDGGPATLAQLNDCEGVEVDNYGNIYIADLANGAIRKVDPSGIISTIAGNYSAVTLGDGGPAIAAMLGWPTGVCINTGGTIYVAEQQGCRIRKLYEHTVNIPGTETPTQWSISPNPCKGTFTLQWPTVQPHTRVLVINIAGQVIKTVSADNVQQVTISLSEPDGIYYLQSTTPTATNAAQIIVQR